MNKLINKYSHLLGRHRFKVRELFFSKKPGTIHIDKLPFKGYLSSLKYLPDIDAALLNVMINHDFSYNGTCIDLINFKDKVILRHNIATPPLSKQIQLARKKIQKTGVAKEIKPEDFFNDFFRTPHTAHMTPNGYICATNIYCIYLIDTNTNEVYFLPDDYDKKQMFYIQSGGFSPDYEYFYFVRWPFEDTLNIRIGKKELAKCEIGRLRLKDRKIDIVDILDLPEEVHQIICTKDYKHLLIACFNMQLDHFVSNAGKEDINEYKKIAQKLSKITTYDLTSKKYWQTQLPLPIPAHFEMDPFDPSVIYASAHNIFSHPKFNTISGGPGGIIKMRINDGSTDIEGIYSDEASIRVTQHRVFIFEGKKYLVFTTTPSQFLIINVEDMSLWRKVQIQPDRPFKYNNGYAEVSSTFPLSLDVSNDCLYIIAGQTDHFYVYDIKNDQMLDSILYLPKGKGLGHTRPVGG